MNPIELQHVSVVFEQEKGKSFLAVDDVSLTVGPGEIFVIMGLSGSGKSTLLRTINGLIRPQKGSVRVHGQDVVRMCPTDLRNLRRYQVSMVFQKFALLPFCTVAENISFGLRIRGEATPKVEQEVVKQLEQMGLSAFKDSYPHQLSGGMQQRVGLARAFAANGDVLLLDEPFSALDPLIRSQLQDELLRLQRVFNKTIVFVTHDFEEARKLASRMVVMQSGRILQTGTPQDIAQKPANELIAQFSAHPERLCSRCEASA